MALPLVGCHFFTPSHAYPSFWSLIVWLTFTKLLESSWTCHNWILLLYAGNCRVIWVRTKYWAGCCLLWKVSWFLSKWRGDNFCKPVQAESGPIFCSAGTVRSYTFFRIFYLLIISSIWIFRPLFVIYLGNFLLAFFCLSTFLHSTLHPRLTFFQCIADCLTLEI